jgi:hypothetical protein
MWPEVTIRAQNQTEVDCLLRALARAGAAAMARPGFRIEVGGIPLGRILNAAQKCLREYEIDAVVVVLRNGREHLLVGKPRA